MMDYRSTYEKIIWTKKPVLRAIYHNYYKLILGFTNNGKTSLHKKTSIVSPLNSFNIGFIRLPPTPTHVPTGSIFRS